jgi:pimeloyl-ACP methyl ester carboxylesterase
VSTPDPGDYGEPLQAETEDGLALSGVHLPGPDRSLAVVVGHGFTGSVSRHSVRRILEAAATFAGVIACDFRGHGDSPGRSTLGDAEVLDLEAAVQAARERGYERIATLGFSMGGSVALRHAALRGGVDAVVSVSALSRWFVRDTLPMRRVHWLCETALGRATARCLMRTRLVNHWDVVPESPVEVVGRIPPTPLLIVHGDRDFYFPVEHPRALAAAAGPDADLWIIAGMGHAELGTTPALMSDIGRWIRARTAGVDEVAPVADRSDPVGP